jgi:hypothetical protein
MEGSRIGKGDPVGDVRTTRGRHVRRRAHITGLRVLSKLHVPRVFGILAIVAGTLASPLGVAPAHAATGDLVCLASGTVTFNPALTLTNTTSNVTASTLLKNCASPNGMHTDLKNAIAASSGSATSAGGINPCSLLLDVKATGAFTWQPSGQKSNFEDAVVTNPSDGTIHINGRVTSGPLNGDPVTIAPIVGHPNLDCAVNGLKSLTFEAAVVVFG